jgi:hypothetical protein
MRTVSIVALKKQELLETESQKFQDTFFANWLSCIYGTSGIFYHSILTNIESIPRFNHKTKADKPKLKTQLLRK